MKRNVFLFLAAAFFDIFPAAAATLTITVADYTFTPNGSVTASSTINLGDTVKWIWSSGSHTTTSTTIPTGAASWDMPINSSATSFSYVPSKVGTYIYVCTPHASMGMTARFYVVCAGGAPATPTITSSNGNTACQGFSVNMSIPPQSGATYQWYLGTTALTNTSPTLNAMVPGSYTVKVSRCGSDATSTPFNVTINPNPAPSFTHTHTGLSYVFTNTTVPATGNIYLWTFSDGSPNQVTTNASRTFSAQGIYTVTLKATTTATGCFAATQVTINTAVGVGTVANISYSVAPNPATNTVAITTKGAAEIAVTDVNGRVVIAPFKTSGTGRKIDVSALPAGLYVLRIVTNEGSAVEKILVAR